VKTIKKVDVITQNVIFSVKLQLSIDSVAIFISDEISSVKRINRNRHPRKRIRSNTFPLKPS